MISTFVLFYLTLFFYDKNIFAKGCNVPHPNYIGDAFCSYSPTLAQGASQSIESANEIFQLIVNNNPDIKNEYYKKRLKKTNLIIKRSKLNYFAFHINNPILVYIRNTFLKYLTKNKKFLENYLGKIYRD